MHHAEASAGEAALGALQEIVLTHGNDSEFSSRGGLLERFAVGCSGQASGGVQFGIYPTRASAGTATVAEWEVADLQAEMKDLRNRGVTFEEYDLPGLKTIDGVAEIGGFKGAWFKDSEGNILAISEGAG